MENSLPTPYLANPELRARLLDVWLFSFFSSLLVLLWGWMDFLPFLLVCFGLVWVFYHFATGGELEFRVVGTPTKHSFHLPARGKKEKQGFC